MSLNTKRPVRRVLVMIDYGDGDAANGEVFDLTALMHEMIPGSRFHNAQLSLTVEAQKSIYEKDQPTQSSISFGGYAGGDFVAGASHLDDVVNASMPDGDTVDALRKKQLRIYKKAEEMKDDIMTQKLRQVAGIRHQHPIARFTERLPELPPAPAAQENNPSP